MGVFNTSGIEAYARALREDPGLWDKVVNYKKPTFKSFANGTCDCPLCDQLVFIYEFLSKDKPEFLSAEKRGKWRVDKTTGFTSIDVNASDGVDAVQPTLANPTDQATLEELRKALQTYILLHLRALRPGG